MTEPTFMLSRQNIQRAIKCEEWQKFRLSLRGELTITKLDKLRTWLEVPHRTEGTVVPHCDRRTRFIQVYNYLNALARGGQIAPVFTRDLEEDRITILKER